MRIFVTAGTGFVGRALTKTLVARGHQVTALVRRPEKARDLTQLGVQLVVGDMLDGETYRQEVRKNDTIIHSAQLTVKGRYTKKSKQLINGADKMMTETLVKECLQHNKALIYTSGCFNYGDHGEKWISEDTPGDPSPLGEGHHAMVAYLMKEHQDNKLKVSIITAGFVYGPGGLFKASFYDTLRKGQLKVFGKGNNYWSPVHLEDLALAYALVAEGGYYGENFNIVDDQPITLRALVDTITAHQGVKKVGNIPPWLLGLFIGLALVKSLTCSFRVRNEKAKELLKWKPAYPDFESGIKPVLKQLNED